MKNKLMILFIGFHLLLIIATSVYMSVDAYCSFYKKESPKDMFTLSLRRILFFKGIDVYSKYTGAETGYGFFAPNVLSSGFLAFEHKGKVFAPRLSNYENRIRFSSLASSFIQHAIQPPQYKPEDSTIRQSDSTYYDLVLKNISVRFMQAYKMDDTLKVRLNLYDYPELKEYAQRKSLKAQFITLYEKKYFFRS